MALQEQDLRVWVEDTFFNLLIEDKEFYREELKFSKITSLSDSEIRELFDLMVDNGDIELGDYVELWD